MIDLTKLKNAVQKDGKTIAQCPACAAAGKDEKEEHLAVYPDGKFGCVANPGDKEHRAEIFKLSGKKGSVPPPRPTLQIKRQRIPESSVLMQIGRLGREKPTPHDATSTQVRSEEAESTSESPPPEQPDEQRSEPTQTRGWGGSSPNGATFEEAREFLRSKVS